MDSRRLLGEFLQTRRSQLRPEDVGLPTYGDRRRVPGLRREELARLAGVSASYYSRLEQGQSSNASPEVLNAIARVLRLDEAEQRHLHELAGGARRRPAGRRPAPQRVTPAVRQLLTALGDVPAVVLGRSSDVLAWNEAGHALFAGHLDPAAPEQPKQRPNMARMVFLDAHTRELYADWPAKARAVVATLRTAAGIHPDDTLLRGLIGELSVASTEFTTMWADHRVKARGDAEYEMRHPLVGTMHVTQQTLRTELDQSIVVATTEAGSPSHAAMTLLAHSVATGRTTAAGRRQQAPAPE
jgi:transcriptional regulator with XRE-family HTH domain